MAYYTKNIPLSLVERISQSVVRDKQAKHSYVRFACPVRVLQSYNGALLEYSMPICHRDRGNLIAESCLRDQRVDEFETRFHGRLCSWSFLYPLRVERSPCCCGMEVRRGRCRLSCHPRYQTTAQN
ncbi:hypothetical protein AVEN_32109-1 [Araneus ventricosus]|uniref:Uncharacterized protein n=1 Tax=Araneus ventricosus TaxID=182803 RepID=A0A4Y2GIX3_ARAVE|nr:hypothetical protein AVEN_32109-1 [Araneus ventricosus]